MVDWSRQFLENNNLAEPDPLTDTVHTVSQIPVPGSKGGIFSTYLQCTGTTVPVHTGGQKVQVEPDPLADTAQENNLPLPLI